jgi:hypothetical protein
MTEEECCAHAMSLTKKRHAIANAIALYSGLCSILWRNIRKRIISQKCVKSIERKLSFSYLTAMRVKQAELVEYHLKIPRRFVSARGVASGLLNFFGIEAIACWCARFYVERMQELTEDAVCYNFAKSKIKTAAEGIPANERDVNRSTRRKNSKPRAIP